MQKKELPSSFKSVFGESRVELKAKIRVSDELLDELVNREILLQRNVDHILVSF